MSLFGFTLVLTAAFCHATWNYIIKKINGGPELVWLFSIIAALLYLPLAIYIFVVSKPIFGTLEIGLILGSSMLHLGYFLLLQQGYRRGDLSLVYPTARATGPFLSTLFAVLILQEQMTVMIAVGGMAIITGVLFLTSRNRQNSREVTVSLVFGASAGILIGSYTVWDAYTVSIVMVPPLLLDYASSLTRSTILAPIAWRRRDEVIRQWREHRLGVLIVAVCNPLAYILVLYALTFTPVIYVAPTRELSVLITVILGATLLGEGGLKQKLPWALVILIGVVLLATG